VNILRSLDAVYSQILMLFLHLRPPPWFVLLQSIETPLALIGAAHFSISLLTNRVR
jgi:hypothetical protein